MSSMKKNTAITASILALGFILGVIATANLNIFAQSGKISVSNAYAAEGRDNPIPDGSRFADIADSVMPSVVTVYSEQVIKVRRQGFNSPNDEFLRRFFGLPGGDLNRAPQYDKYRQEGLGSGVVISADGYILTNNHVIANADDIQVKVGEKTYKAKIVGADEKTDLAVLKIEPDAPLKAATLGDSSKIRVGEWVLAIGQPFNLDHTVTAGIISAKGRDRVGISDYEDFLQTDAAINPGNSGGALVDMNGEVIGINTAIASRTGVYNGVGFAIPSNMAKRIVEQLIENGRVSRGYIGIGIQDLTPELAEAIGIDRTEGVLVTQVLPDMPGEKAGLRSSDVIVSIDGSPFKSASKLRNIVASDPPGTEIELGVVRDGREKKITVKLSGVPGSEDTTEVASKEKPFDLGLSLAPAERSELAQFGYSSGLIVEKVEQLSPAERAGIIPGDIVFEVNRRSVSSVADFNRLVDKTPTRKPILLLVGRGGGMLYVVVKKSND